MANRAVHSPPNQLMWTPVRVLITPKSALNMSRQTSSIANDGMAYGSTISSR